MIFSFAKKSGLVTIVTRDLDDFKNNLVTFVTMIFSFAKKLGLVTRYLDDFEKQSFVIK